MKKHLKYKKSNVNWIGDIPEHWQISKAKFSSSFRMGQTILKEDLIEDGKFPVYSATEGDHYFGRINNPSFILEVGDIVIPARGNSIGHISLVYEESVSTQTTIANFVNKNKINSKYLYYYYKGFRNTLFQYDNTAIPQITVEQVKQNLILLPPFEEQFQIASYLDHQTSIVNDLIKQKEKLNELLREKRYSIINETVTNGLKPNAKMKYSGINWLGNIPIDRSLISIRYLTTKVGSGVTPKGGAEVYTEEGVIFIRSQNVHFDGLRLDDVVKIDNDTHEEMSGSKVFHKDVLLNITGASIGRCCVVNINEEMNVNQHVCIIRPNNKIIPEYLNLLLKSSIGQTQVKLGTTGGNREGLTFEAIKDFILPIPEIPIQMEIVDKIEASMRKFEEIESKNNFQIEKLKEYRQSIISEAVTGKIDLREWLANNQKEV
jgi:type I restriction enzyme S subunit